VYSLNARIPSPAGLFAPAVSGTGSALTELLAAAAVAKIPAAAQSNLRLPKRGSIESSVDFCFMMLQSSAVLLITYAGTPGVPTSVPAKGDKAEY